MAGIGPSGKDINCANCNKFLMHGVVIEGFIDKQCRICGSMNHVTNEGVTIIPKEKNKPFQDRLKLERK